MSARAPNAAPIVSDDEADDEEDKKSVIEGDVEKPFFTGSWPGNCNSIEGNIGFSFRPRCDCYITALGRHLNGPTAFSSFLGYSRLTTTSVVRIWAVETKILLVAIDVGPTSPVEGDYAFEQVLDVVRLRAGKEYRITQWCSKDMADKWFDGVLAKEDVASNTADDLAEFVAGVRSDGTGYPDIVNNAYQRAGIVNFKFHLDDTDAEKKDCSSFDNNQWNRRAPNQGGRRQPAPSTDSVILRAVAEKSSELPVKTGYLSKARPGWLVGWTWRWFVLQDKVLRWYTTEKDDVALGILDFDLAECQLEKMWTSEDKQLAGKSTQVPGGLSSNICSCRSRSSRSCDPFDGLAPAFAKSGHRPGVFRISPIGGDRFFELSCSDVAEAETWIDAIQKHMQLAAASRTSSIVPRQVFEKKWWKTHRITPEKFASIAQTGDILQFRSYGAMPRVIRLATGGIYDHVGLILKLEGGKVGIFESTGNEGVSIVTWEEFLENNWQTLYPRMALRRVSCPRTQKEITDLQTWCCNVLGKPYSLTVGKLKRRSSLKEDDADRHQDFFCSELVAEALKEFGVIPRGVSSTRYYPGLFSSSKRPQIETCPGCSFLEEDLIIEFALGDGEEHGASGSGPTKARDNLAAWQ